MIQTHEIEKQIYKLYKMSRDKTNVEQAEKANNLMEEIIRFFQLLDLFMNDQHAEIVKRIYFHRQNMFRVGIRAVSFQIFIPERTLYKYRQKYCEIIAEILEKAHFD